MSLSATPVFTADLFEVPLDALLAAARVVRDRAHGTRITYSPKVSSHSRCCVEINVATAHSRSHQRGSISRTCSPTTC